MRTAARLAPVIAFSVARRSLKASEGRCRFNISRLPRTTWRRLLKSCATPSQVANGLHFLALAQLVFRPRQGGGMLPLIGDIAPDGM